MPSKFLRKKIAIVVASVLAVICSMTAFISDSLNIFGFFSINKNKTEPERLPLLLKPNPQDSAATKFLFTERQIRLSNSKTLILASDYLFITENSSSILNGNKLDTISRNEIKYVKNITFYNKSKLMDIFYKEDIPSNRIKTDQNLSKGDIITCVSMLNSNGYDIQIGNAPVAPEYYWVLGMFIIAVASIIVASVFLKNTIHQFFSVVFGVLMMIGASISSILIFLGYS